ncbi:ABC transporter permease subunit [Bifidobacterium pullorum subsp. saeculare]|uniref:ABC transporter permease subunit n=1 Tax=Bifidobacterium pullorum subsp. saeculare TaxID=78257 RepID=A0A938WU60_9BIFI|nr:ABC transporter permease subunit [Bifidobacterium pullorum]MBM6698800.1 ABC transporter permease subunit [Bifidobacterium pullorum subsp. saeculare]
MSFESIQARKQLGNIRPTVVNYVRRPAKPRETELKAIAIAVAAFFALFLLLPLVLALTGSFQATDGSVTAANYLAVFAEPGFLTAVGNSVKVSAASAAVAVALAFLLAYTVNCTDAPRGLRTAIRLLAQVPMLLPTITYGFAIIYSLGRQGLITRLLGGHQPIDIYGFNGLLIGYVVYTMPTCFLLLDNGFRFLDRRFIIVSHVMGDRPAVSFLHTVVRPLAGVIGVAFVQSFFLSFTDYGIPTSVGGTYDTLAMALFGQMLGSMPDFNRGAVIAMVMLAPSLLSIALFAVLNRLTVRTDHVSRVALPRGRRRDALCAAGSLLVLAAVLSLFVVILVVPFVTMWPFLPAPTLAHVADVFADPSLMQVLANSLLVAALTALLGTVVAYGAPLATARSHLPRWVAAPIDALGSVINTVPSMVLGIGFLFAFTGSPLQNTVAILVVCNVVHYFATPYQMMRDTLGRMNGSYETTARLMGDTWLKTLRRVITPNAAPALLQVFGYYFVNAMVTISAVVFLTGATTQVLTTQISALQHLTKFDSVFVLSLFILVANLAVKSLVALGTALMARRRARLAVSKAA